MASLTERLDAQLAAFLSDWSLITTAFALAIVGLHPPRPPPLLPPQHRPRLRPSPAQTRRLRRHPAHTLTAKSTRLAAHVTTRDAAGERTVRYPAAVLALKYAQ
jgi:hypothetical protein